MTMRGRARFYLASLVILLPLNFIYNQQFIWELYLRIITHKEKVVISLTTTPYRINKIEPILETILNQNAKVQAIYLNIPYIFNKTKTSYDIPSWIQNHPRIKILRTYDYGPATKLLGLLEREKLDPETIIITLDDDVFYPRNLVLHLVHQAMRYKDAAISVSGANIDYDALGLVNTKTLMGLIHKYDKPGTVDILQGYAGIAYRVKFFDNDIFSILDAPQSCYWADDLYFSFYLARSNYSRRVLTNRYVSAYHLNWVNEIGTDTDALHLQSPTPAHRHAECLAYLKDLYPQVIF